MDKNTPQFSLADFVGSNADVQAKLAAKGLPLGPEQVKSLRHILANTPMAEDGRQSASSTEICDPELICPFVLS
jgi:hypothetical protein